MLKGFGAELQETVRGGDLVCRLGGEEFVVVMPGADAAEAARIAERARRTTESREFLVDAPRAPFRLRSRLVSPNGGRTGIPPNFIVERTGRFTYRNPRAAIASLTTPRDPQGGVAAASFRRQNFSVARCEDRLEDRFCNVTNDRHAHAIPANMIGIVVALGKTVTVVQTHQPCSLSWREKT